MSPRKPRRAVPVRRARRYARSSSTVTSTSAGRTLAVAGLFGLLAGAGSIAVSADGRARIAAVAKPVAVGLGFMRARAPQVGDYWSGCGAARAAGSAPIYLGEPGYRDEMDGDDDGVACEPYHGR